jgi:peptide deformylase
MESVLSINYMENKTFQENLSVFVSDNVAPADKMGGSPPAEQELRELAMKYLGRYVPAHNMPSRKVEEKDVPRVVEEGKIMITLCSIPRGGTTGAEAIAHMQIDDKDPLSFFVTKRGEIIINPRIVRHSGYTVGKVEGCMSFPEEPAKEVSRYHKIEAAFQTLIKNEKGEPILSEEKTLSLSGFFAQIFQHEISHILGWNIFDHDYIEEACVTKRA